MNFEREFLDSLLVERERFGSTINKLSRIANKSMEDPPCRDGNWAFPVAWDMVAEP